LRRRSRRRRYATRGATTAFSTIATSCGDIRTCRPRCPHGPHLAERADAADLVAGHPLGIGGLHHLGRLSLEGRGQLLHRDLTIGGHDHAGGLAVDQGHQGFQHARRRLAQRLGRLQADLVGIGIVVVGVDREADLRLLQRLCGARDLRHPGSSLDEEQDSVVARQFPFRIFAVASAKTWHPSTMSASWVFSVK
jgi:hypothetical protein